MTTHIGSTAAAQELPADLTEALRNARILLGLSQQKLADMVGASLATVRRWEAGEAAPNSLPFRARIHDVLLTADAVRQAQQTARGVLDQRFAARPELGSQDGTPLTPDEALDGLLELLDEPGLVDRAVQDLRGKLWPAISGVVATVSTALAGSTVADLPESMLSRLERDCLRPFVLLLVASSRDAIVEAKGRLTAGSGAATSGTPEPGGKKRGTKTPHP